MGMKMGKLFGTRVLVQPIKPHTELDEVEKKGLLYIPETVKDQNTPLPSVGFVLALGDQLIQDFKYPDGWYPNYGEEKDMIGLPDSEWPIKEGDAVMFSKYAGSEVAIDKETYRIIEYKEIMCTLLCEDQEAYAVTTD